MFAIKASCAFAVKQKCNQAQREGASRLLRSREHSKKLPIPKLQAPKKHQAPSSKTNLRAVGLGICFSGLVFEIWNFSGGWGLVLGVSPSGGPPEHLLASAV